MCPHLRIKQRLLTCRHKKKLNCVDQEDIFETVCILDRHLLSLVSGHLLWVLSLGQRLKKISSLSLSYPQSSNCISPVLSDLQPMDLQLIEANGTSASIEWELDPAQSLSKQGALLRVVMARIGNLPDENENEDEPRKAGGQPAGKGDMVAGSSLFRHEKKPQTKSRYVPHFDKVKELSVTNRTHFRMVDVDLSDEVWSANKKRTFVVVFNNMILLLFLHICLPECETGMMWYPAQYYFCFNKATGWSTANAAQNLSFNFGMHQLWLCFASENRKCHDDRSFFLLPVQRLF